MQLSTRKIDISDLKPAPYNPRKDLKPGDAEYEKLAASIEAFGYLEPIVYNERTGNVISGHQRLKVLKAKGETRVDCVVVDFDPDTEKAANIALNKISGDWDFAKLADLLLELDSANFDLDLTGFGEDEVKQIMGWTPGFETPEEDFDPEEALEQAPTRVQRGQIWQCGKHRVMCGDSTSAEDVKRLMGGQKALLYATDPPYAVDYVEKARDMNKRGYVHSRATLSSDIEGDGLKAGQEEGLWREVFTLAAEHALEQNAAWYVWHGGSRAMLAMCNLLCEIGLLFHQTIVWRKNNFVIGRCDYQANSEACFYGWMKGNRPPFYGKKNQTTVWDVARDTNKPDHPTQKPVEVFTIPILNHTKENELVHDSFLGSGTTLIAAEQTGRVCYGMEISPRYCDVVLERWEKLTGGQASLLETCPQKTTDL